MSSAFPPNAMQALRPPLISLEKSVRELACADIKDPILRSNMMGNRRISRRIFDVILAQLGLPDDDALVVGDAHENLVTALTIDRTALVLSLGLAGESQRVARHLFNNDLTSDLREFDFEELRRALSYREMTEDCPPDPLTLEDVHRTGEEMLGQWVWSLPGNVRGRVALSLNVSEAVRVPQPKAVDLANRVISEIENSK